MPKSEETWELPEIFDSWLDNMKPVRIAQNRLAFPSPLPMYFSAEEYQKWWNYAGKGQDDDDETNSVLWHWKTCFHLIRDFKLDNVDTSVIEKDGLGLPDQRILVWFWQITSPLIFLATDLPNWLEPSSEI
jgi:hypothetical protein